MILNFVHSSSQNSKFCHPRVPAILDFRHLELRELLDSVTPETSRLELPQLHTKLLNFVTREVPVTYVFRHFDTPLSSTTEFRHL